MKFFVLNFLKNEPNSASIFGHLKIIFGPFACVKPQKISLHLSELISLCFLFKKILYHFFEKLEHFCH